MRGVGPRGNDIYKNFKLAGADRSKYKEVMKKFDEFCKLQEEKFRARHRLLYMKQEGVKNFRLD